MNNVSSQTGNNFRKISIITIALLLVLLLAGQIIYNSGYKRLENEIARVRRVSDIPHKGIRCSTMVFTKICTTAYANLTHAQALAMMKSAGYTFEYATSEEESNTANNTLRGTRIEIKSDPTKGSTQITYSLR